METNIPRNCAVEPSGRSQARRPFILVVDDNVFRRAWKKRALADGLKVVEVSSATQGLRHLRRVRFDVIVVGEHPRGMGTKRFQQAVRERYPDIPIVVFPLKTPVEWEAKSLSPGAYRMLIDSMQDKQAELRAMVDMALGRSSGERQEGKGKGA